MTKLHQSYHPDQWFNVFCDPNEFKEESIDIVDVDNIESKLCQSSHLDQRFHLWQQPAVIIKFVKSPSYYSNFSPRDKKIKFLQRKTKGFSILENSDPRDHRDRKVQETSKKRQRVFFYPRELQVIVENYRFKRS